MCGIFGVGFLNLNGAKAIYEKEQIINLIRELFLRNEMRGRVSSGIALATKDEMVYSKAHLPATTFCSAAEFKAFLEENLSLEQASVKPRTFALIGHCRLDTKGSPKNNLNNHPILAGEILGVHNGTISNDDSLFELSKGKIKRVGEVDSEIIFQLINYYRQEKEHYMATKETYMIDAIKTTSDEIQGGYACAVLSGYDPYKLYLFKNTYASLSIKYFEKLGLVIASSTEDAIERSMTKVFMPHVLKHSRHVNCVASSGVVVNTEANQYVDFKLSEKRSVMYDSGCFED